MYVHKHLTRNNFPREFFTFTHEIFYAKIMEASRLQISQVYCLNLIITRTFYLGWVRMIIAEPLDSK